MGAVGSYLDRADLRWSRKVSMSEEDVERIAKRVVELLAQQQPVYVPYVPPYQPPWPYPQVWSRVGGQA